MYSSKSNFPILSAFLIFSVSILVFVSIKTYSQSSDKPEYLSLLDSVKIYYGDTCSIGISSGLFNRLYKYKEYTPVKDYLNDYDSVRTEIEQFRSAYIKTVQDEPALLLDLTRIFKRDKEQNLANVCGIYLGPDSVTSVSMSYITMRTSPAKFYSKIYQVSNFSQAFKKEIGEFGDDWYKSIVLKEIIKFPLK